MLRLDKSKQQTSANKCCFVVPELEEVLCKVHPTASEPLWDIGHLHWFVDNLWCVTTYCILKKFYKATIVQQSYYILYIYICISAHYTDTTASTLTRLSSETVKDIQLKIFFDWFKCFNGLQISMKNETNWPRNKKFSAQNLDLLVVCLK